MIFTGNPTRFVDSVKFSKGRIYFHGEIVTSNLGTDILGEIQTGREHQ